jgi:hypothetical protein
MDTIIWTPEKLRFGRVAIDALVARSPREDLLELELEAIRTTLATDETLIHRCPPSIVGEPIGFSPKGKPIYRPKIQDSELWRVRGVGSFDSIRFAKDVFNAPADEWFREGVGSLEAIIAKLSEGFAEGDFKLSHVDPVLLSFILTTPNTNVTPKQLALLDKLNERFFNTDATGKHMKAVHLSAPGFFAIGAA